MKTSTLPPQRGDSLPINKHAVKISKEVIGLILINALYHKFYKYHHVHDVFFTCKMLHNIIIS